jgi:hypothetical protein
LIKRNQNDSANKVLDKLLMLFPNNIMYFDVYMIQVADDYYKIKEYAKANEIVKTIAYNFKNNNKSDYNYPDDGTFHSSYTAVAIYAELQRMAKEYDQQDLLKYLEKNYPYYQIKTY